MLSTAADAPPAHAADDPMTIPTQADRAAATAAVSPAVMVEVVHLRTDADRRWHYRHSAGPLSAHAAPDDAARRLAGLDNAANPATVLHSTSWRYDPGGHVVLTYAVLPDPDPTAPATLLDSNEIARGSHPGRPAPDHIVGANVVAHAIRHLAQLVDTDPVVAAALRRDHVVAASLAAHTYAHTPTSAGESR